MQKHRVAVIASLVLVVLLAFLRCDFDQQIEAPAETPEYFGLSSTIDEAEIEKNSHRGVNEEWTVDAPENHGMSGELLKEVDKKVYRIGGRQGYVIIRNGVLVHEKYYWGNSATKNIAWSVTKAFGATMVGIACTMGLLDLDDQVTRWIDKPYYAFAVGVTVPLLLLLAA
jgi:CubicO group peptidase (beta-lactamase class C family)